MKRFLLAGSILFPLASVAQAPARVTVAASHVLDSTGSAALARGQLCFVTTDGMDQPMSYRIRASSGQTLAYPDQTQCVPVTNGSISPIQFINSGASSPLNACIRVVTRDAKGMEIRRNKCVQTGTSEALTSWCTQSGGAVTCNWDQFPTGSTPVVSAATGPQRLQGAPGCVAGGAGPAGCGASLSPQSIAGRGFPATEDGTDLAAKVKAALTRMGGTAGHPVERAVLELPVGVTFTTSPIVLPTNNAPPYVNNVDLICHGNVLTSTSASQPIIHVLAYNNNGGMNSGSVSGCIFNDPASSPALQVDSRQAFEVYNNLFIHGSVGLRETNTMFNDGGPGYHEQHWIHNNDFADMTVAGVEFLVNGGTDSFEYGSVDWTNHFQLVCGAAAIHLGPGVTIQGGELSGRINTTSSSCATPTTAAVAIRNDAAGSGNGVYRGSSGHWTGEDTGQLGPSHFALFGGPGATTLIDHGVIVGGMSLRAANANPFSHVSLPYSPYTTTFGTDNCANVDDEGAGAGFLLARKPIFANCQNSARMYSGGEGWGDMGHIYYGGPNPQAMTSTRSIWRSFAAGFTFGPGYSPRKSDGKCLDPAGCNGGVDPAEGQSLTIKVPGNATNHGLRTHAEKDGVHITMQNQSGPGGQPTEWLIFDGYDSTAGTYGVRTFLKGRFEGGTYVWYFPMLTGSGCANLVVRADGSVARGATVTCP